MTIVLALLVGLVIGSRRLSEASRIPGGFSYVMRAIDRTRRRAPFALLLYLRWPGRVLVAVGWSSSRFDAGPMVLYVEDQTGYRIERDWTWLQTPQQAEELARIRADNLRLRTEVERSR